MFVAHAPASYLALRALEEVRGERLRALFWLGILCAVLWVVLMALIDWWATRAFYGRDEVVNTVQIELLKNEVRKYQEEQGK